MTYGPMVKTIDSLVQELADAAPMRRYTRLLSPGDPRHGTDNGYHNHSCRCDLCRKAATDYARELRLHPRRKT